jgi:hypothetical protein
MLDLHEDPTARGFYLYQYGLDDISACEKIVASVNDMGYPIEKDLCLNIYCRFSKTEIRYQQGKSTIKGRRKCRKPFPN